MKWKVIDIIPCKIIVADKATFVYKIWYFSA